ncbi:MAG: copper amine oxidase N-terminal domain-containing protein [Peptoniphilus sp.]|nr:copper amine oxidase N-terminal domain-containing protein [Peptoniphilus sp.]MDD7363867.1 copper amine oxidase N-terminal domain-containing protein [Bacillota bacterium]MDY6044294.1 copper amine oxidase N-terminal domain-containing protein [Peptoniphilus sp.]
MKKVKLWIGILILLSISIPAYAQKPVQLWVDGDYVNSDVPPIIQNNRTLVPIRFISEELGYKVTWDDRDRTISITSKTSSSDNVLLAVGSRDALVKGSNKKMDTPARIINNRTFVPLRFIAEAFSQQVDWDSINRTVIIGEGYTAPKVIVPPGTIVPEYLYDGKLSALPLSKQMEFELANSERDSKYFIGYSNKDVEAAIVWLTMFNIQTHYAYVSGAGEASLENGAIARTIQFKGSPINTYSEDSLTWPRHVTSLYNDTFSANMTTIDYAPNYDGTITVYYPPTRWMCNPEECAELERRALSKARIVELDKVKKEDLQPILSSISHE